MLAPVKPVAALSALRERNLALLIASGTISSLGSGMAQVALAFAVLRIGNASDLGYVFLAREIPTVAFLLLGGVWADRISRKWLLVIGDATTGAAQALTAILFLTHQAEIWNVAALQVVFGVANAFTRPASTGLIPQAVSVAHLQEANALSDLGRSTMRIAGPAIGAAIVVTANPGWALAADAVTFMVSGLLRMQMRIAPTVRAQRSRLVADLRDGWGEFTSRTWVWVMVVSFGFFQLTLFPALLVLGPVVAEDHLGGAGAWGAILACQAAGSVAGGLIALRLRPDRPLLASSLLMLPTAGFLAMLGLAAPVVVLCLVGFIAAVGLTSGDIFWMTTFQRRIPEHLISRLSSFDWLGSVALNPIGYALVGPLAGVIGVAETLYFAAAINACVSIAVALAPSIRGLRISAEPAAVVAT
jgi:MFS family permease